MIDNYDSFTYIIVQYLQQLGQQVKVISNDEYQMDQLINDKDLCDFSIKDIKAIIIGPGPGRPEEAGITLDAIKHFAGSIPIFGICLGHQAIAMAYGAKIIQAEQIMHGRVSAIYHHSTGVFLDLPCPVTMTRYHSLIVDKDTLPNILKITAWTHKTEKHMPQLQQLQANPPLSNPIQTTTTQHSDLYNPAVSGIMGIRHRHLKIEGVQFHPESILSDAGLQLLNNFLIQHDLAIFSQADIRGCNQRLLS